MKIKIALVLAAMIIDGFIAVSAARQGLPEGKGVEIARDKCLSCHESDLIISQRLSRQSWTREVEKMVRWGASVTEAEKEPLIDYLAANFGAKTVEAKDPAGENRGKEIFENRCLLCHEADLTRQQRLSRQGWTREVEKMIRWGAVVADAEKEPLIDYLFKNYGPRR
jgi:cytochrome c-type biogenesis protein CcmH/NrfF